MSGYTASGEGSDLGYMPAEQLPPQASSVPLLEAPKADSLPEVPKELMEIAEQHVGGIFGREAGAIEPQSTALAVPVDRSPRPVQMAFGELEGPEQAHLLGLSTLILPTGVVIGYRFGGGYGAAAGALFAGAAINVLRATRVMNVDRREAVISGTYAALATGLGAYLAWTASKRKKDG